MADALREPHAIGAAGCETPRLDAELLLAHVLGVGRERLITDRDLTVSGPAVRAFQDAVRRVRCCASRSPTSSASAASAICSSTSTPRTDPRPESELLVEVALSLPRGSRVIDLCTGSGAVALALKDERPDLEVHGERHQRGGARARARERRALNWRSPGTRRTC